MMDINISFADIFRGCFARSRNNEPKDRLHSFKMALKKSDKPQTQIKMLLGKITNGKYHSSFLFKFTSENTFEITDFYGDADFQTDTELLCKNIPIMDMNQVVWVLCVRSEKMKPIAIQEELVDLLTDIIEVGGFITKSW